MIKQTTMKFFKSLMLLSSILFLFGFQVAEDYGQASYYSDKYQGRATASGELYDKNKLTCAHKTFPFGTILKVTRLDNKKSVRVRVNDRGPFVSGRIVDLSRKAAVKVDLITAGTAKVKIEVVSMLNDAEDLTTDIAPANPAKRPDSFEKPIVKKEPRIPSDKAVESARQAELAEKKARDAKAAEAEAKRKRLAEAEAAAKAKAEKEKAAQKKKAAAQKAKSALKEAVPATPKNSEKFDLYKIRLLKPEKKGFGVQVGVYSSYESLLTSVVQLQEQFFDNTLMSVEEMNGKTVYKVVLGPFPDRKTAEGYKKALKAKKIQGFIIDLSTLEKK